jgi:CheY-like chemotaxis protein
LALGADAYCQKPIDRARLVQMIARLAAPDSIRRVLVVDDEEVCRYVLRQHLVTPRHVITEAASGADALRLAREEHPDVICLDLRMPDLAGEEVLRRLKADPATRDIPVIVITSTAVNDAQRRALGDMAADVLSKDSVSRERTLAVIDAAIRTAGAA